MNPKDLVDDVIGAFGANEAALRRALSRPDGPLEAEAPPLDGGVNYLLCYVPRSGTHHLCSLLQATSAAGAPAEYLNLAYAEMPQEHQHMFARTGVYGIAHAAEAYGCSSVSGYLRTVASKTRSGNGVFGLKVDLSHASILLRRALFVDREWSWRYIFVTRDDVLSQAVSYAVASATGLWTSESGQAREFSLSVAQVADALRLISDHERRWHCVFSLFGIQPLRITYEEIEATPGGVLTRCLRHLGATQAPITMEPMRSRYRKQRSAVSTAWIEDVRAQLCGVLTT